MLFDCAPAATWLYSAGRASIVAAAALLGVTQAAWGSPPPAARAGAGSPPVAARMLDAASLMDWAQRQLPDFFPDQAGTLTGDGFVYRHYPSTQNFIAVTSGGEVYVLGPPTANQLKSVGKLAALSCAVYPENCNAPVQVAKANLQTVGGTQVGSSTRLALSWSAALGGTVHHYAVSATESVGNTTVSATASAADTSLTLTGLKAATPYSVSVTACGDSLCGTAANYAVSSGNTDGEYWQLQGSGNSTAGLSRIVSDGNARISATRFGPEAGAATASRIQLYYGPSGQMRQILSTALTSSATSASNPSSYLNFVSSLGQTGLLTPTPAAPMVEVIATGQGVPLSAAMGAKVRLFFEAQGADKKTRIFSIDSVDGYVGQDFNSGSATTCATTADFSTGGGCAFTVAIGVEGDSVAPNSKILNARQNKVGYPTQTDWRWDGAPGTFMVFTSGAVSGCTTADRTHGYAVWDGSNWKVQYQSNGCPKLFTNVQAAFPMHLGGVRYKLYYGDTSVTTGRLNSPLPFLGPKQLLYADGTLTGSSDRVDFEDWEAQGKARNVIFVWPNGEPLNDTAEGYIDDFHFLAPTGSLDLQVMYLAITNGTEVPLGAAAVLLNP